MPSTYCPDTDDEDDYQDKLIVSSLCWDSWKDIPPCLNFIGRSQKRCCVIALLS